eukprot:COSAG02_NODE_5423_length_4344_cov_4.697527_1_plen_1126_part_00
MAMIPEPIQEHDASASCCSERGLIGEIEQGPKPRPGLEWEARSKEEPEPEPEMEPDSQRSEDCTSTLSSTPVVWWTENQVVQWSRALAVPWASQLASALKYNQIDGDELAELAADRLGQILLRVGMVEQDLAAAVAKTLRLRDEAVENAAPVPKQPPQVAFLSASFRNDVLRDHALAVTAERSAALVVSTGAMNGQGAAQPLREGKTSLDVLSSTVTPTGSGGCLQSRPNCAEPCGAVHAAVLAAQSLADEELTLRNGLGTATHQENSKPEDNHAKQQSMPTSIGRKSVDEIAAAIEDLLQTIEEGIEDDRSCDNKEDATAAKEDADDKAESTQVDFAELKASKPMVAQETQIVAGIEQPDPSTRLLEPNTSQTGGQSSWWLTALEHGKSRQVADSVVLAEPTSMRLPQPPMAAKPKVSKSRPGCFVPARAVHMHVRVESSPQTLRPVKSKRRATTRNNERSTIQKNHPNSAAKAKVQQIEAPSSEQRETNVVVSRQAPERPAWRHTSLHYNRRRTHPYQRQLALHRKQGQTHKKNDAQRRNSGSNRDSWWLAALDSPQSQSIKKSESLKETVPTIKDGCTHGKLTLQQACSDTVVQENAKRQEVDTVSKKAGMIPQVKAAPLQVMVAALGGGNVVHDTECSDSADVVRPAQLLGDSQSDILDRFDEKPAEMIAVTKIAAIIRGKMARKRVARIQAKAAALAKMFGDFDSSSDEEEDVKEGSSEQVSEASSPVPEDRIASSVPAAAWVAQALDEIDGQIEDEVNATIRIQAAMRGKAERKINANVRFTTVRTGIENVENAFAERALEGERSYEEGDTDVPAFEPVGWSVHYPSEHEQKSDTEEPLRVVDRAEDWRADQTATDSAVVVDSEDTHVQQQRYASKGVAHQEDDSNSQRCGAILHESLPDSALMLAGQKFLPVSTPVRPMPTVLQAGSSWWLAALDHESSTATTSLHSGKGSVATVRSAGRAETVSMKHMGQFRQRPVRRSRQGRAQECNDKQDVSQDQHCKDFTLPLLDQPRQPPKQRAQLATPQNKRQHQRKATHKRTVATNSQNMSTSDIMPPREREKRSNTPRKPVSQAAARKDRHKRKGHQTARRDTVAARRHHAPLLGVSFHLLEFSLFVSSQ